ncbi:MAG: VCBS repeat-containing protein [Bryobacteraceae bacterium]|nr:VCBS repeat-containing protein [Bryobacteraceae bacterium]
MRFALFWALLLAAAQPPVRHETAFPDAPMATGPLAEAMTLLRSDKTAEGRRILERLIKEKPQDAELHYQMARSYLLDFYKEGGGDPAKGRVALNQAMEWLASAIKRDPDYIPALKAKSVIHARAELLFYDPDLAYDLASRVVKLQPHANEFLLTLTEWMSGEVRFTQESGHRVPHDPLLGLDRSITLLQGVVDNSMPYSNEEAAALFLMGKTLARRGLFARSMEYFRQALARAKSADQRIEVLREWGAACYRMNDFGEAARLFHEALQTRVSSVDQWLLKTAMDQMEQRPRLPADLLFPAAEAPKGAPPFSFKDIAPELGLNRFDGNGTVAFGDYDQDGDLDIFLSGSGTFIAVYRNDGGKFTEVTEAAGLAKAPSGYSLNLIDYDNDGRLDLYMSLNGWSGPMPNLLFHNEGGGRFADVSKASGAADPGSGFVALWGDLDNDGFLDLAVANGVIKDGSTPQVYRNNRNGTFTNMTKAAGILEPASFGAIGIALGDYDRDGDLDLLVNGLEPAPNRLYRNDGNWKFTEVSRRLVLNQPVHNGFVCVYFDYTNDGRPDVLTTALASWEAAVEGLKALFTPPGGKSAHADASRLFRNDGPSGFTDVTVEAGLARPMGVMGGGVADLDNDGFLDIYFGTGDPQLSRLEPNRVFRNNGDGTFSDATSTARMSRAGQKGHGAAFADIDEDGDLDVYAQLGGHYPGDHAENAFYRNLSGNRNHWLEIDLEGVKSNRFAIGAQVTVKAGGSLYYREVKGSEGFGATNPWRQHFGLGRNAQVDSVEVAWPSGVKQRFGPMEANRILAIREDADQPRRVK